MLKSYFKVTNRQWFGLVISILISVLIWCQLVFVFHRNKNEDPNNIQISKYQWCGLLISIVIGILSWFKTVNIVDK